MEMQMRCHRCTLWVLFNAIQFKWEWSDLTPSVSVLKESGRRVERVTAPNHINIVQWASEVIQPKTHPQRKNIVMRISGIIEYEKPQPKSIQLELFQEDLARLKKVNIVAMFKSTSTFISSLLPLMCITNRSSDRLTDVILDCCTFLMNIFILMYIPLFYKSYPTERRSESRIKQEIRNGQE